MPRAIIEAGDHRWRVELDGGTPISIRLTFDGDQPNAFHLPEARAEVVEAGDFVGDTRRGGSVNCRTVALNPHGNGTHTESVGHVIDDAVPVGELARTPLVPAALLSAPTTPLDETSERYAGRTEPDDAVVTRASLERAVSTSDIPDAFLRALVVRTLPNPSDKRSRHYSGTNPPYPSTDAVEWMRDLGVEHLVVDLPSIDREDDGGEVPNHRAFWGLSEGGSEEASRPECTVTELAFVPDALDDGLYFLDLQLPDFDLDAAPSRPVLVEASPLEEG